MITNILADLRSKGIEIETDGARLRWRPDYLVSPETSEKILRERNEMIRLLMGPDPVNYCPTCHWPLDSRSRCVKCLDRLCVDCGKATGSFLIMRCSKCGIDCVEADGFSA